MNKASLPKEPTVVYMLCLLYPTLNVVCKPLCKPKTSSQAVQKMRHAGLETIHHQGVVEAVTVPLRALVKAASEGASTVAVKPGRSNWAFMPACVAAWRKVFARSFCST